ncbi:MAG: DUF1631 domain-containing protein, partial [Gammaproteobacteria bacterium]|nr:DUF1631 domain-containing protein [Gammaproteobacteria bacterium]
LTGKMESVVNYVLEEFDQDISVFETALENLNQLIATETSNVEIANEMVAQQEQEREQQINVAQQAAVKLITRVCEKRDLSYEVSDFLETTWTSVLFHTHLSQGESSNHWKNLCRTTSTLVWTLLPKFTEAQRAKIMHTLPALLRALSKGMGLVKVGSDTQNRIFRMLAQEHARVVKQTSQNIVTRVDDDTVWPDDNKIADAFAGFNAASKKGVAAKPKAVAPKAKETDPIAFISSEPTQEIILNLDQFTASVKRGDVEIDEEIVLASVDNTTPSNSDNTQDDEFPALAQSLQIGAWVEFREQGSSTIHTRLSWKSNVTGKMVFVNRYGVKVKSLSVNAFAIELRAERAILIESSSAFDRAINTIVNSIRPYANSPASS